MRRPVILIVDDEPRYREVIRANLEASGYATVLAADGRAALDQASQRDPDLVLLDVRLPDLSGFEVCQKLRAESPLPIIFLTAKAEDADKIRGLRLGADDYITKPFSADELLARVEAVLRRTRFPHALQELTPFERPGLRVDYAARQVQVGGREIHLTPTEFGLLRLLTANAGRVLVQDELLRQVWGPGYEGDGDLLRTTIGRLRQKIEPCQRQPAYILTERGIGYRFAPAAT